MKCGSNHGLGLTTQPASHCRSVVSIPLKSRKACFSTPPERSGYLPADGGDGTVADAGRPRLDGTLPLQRLGEAGRLRTGRGDADRPSGGAGIALNPLARWAVGEGPTQRARWRGRRQGQFSLGAGAAALWVQARRPRPLRRRLGPGGESVAPREERRVRRRSLRAGGEPVHRAARPGPGSSRLAQLFEHRFAQDRVEARLIASTLRLEP